MHSIPANDPYLFDSTVLNQDKKTCIKNPGHQWLSADLCKNCVYKSFIWFIRIHLHKLFYKTVNESHADKPVHTSVLNAVCLFPLRPVLWWRGLLCGAAPGLHLSLLWQDGLHRDLPAGTCGCRAHRNLHRSGEWALTSGPSLQLETFFFSL